VITAAPVRRGSESYYGRYATIGDTGVWLGNGLDAFGLDESSGVEKSTFERFLRGEGLPGVFHPARRPGWDFTVAAPKSVSLLALAHPEEAVRELVLTAHRRAVKRAVDHLCEHAAAVRVSSGTGGRTVLAPAGIVAAAFDHAAARPVRSAGEARVQPHLHTHVVIPNLALRTFEDPDHVAEERFRAIAERVLYEHAPAAGAVYRQALASALHELGFTIARHGFSFDVAGFPAAVLQHFSARAEQIRAALAQEDEDDVQVSRDQQLRTQRRTRAGKVDEELTALAATVRHELRGLGFRFDALSSQPPLPNTDPDMARLEILSSALLDHKPGHRPAGLVDRYVTSVLAVAMRGRHWCREADLWVAVGSSLPAGASVEDLSSLVELVLSHDETVPLAGLGSEDGESCTRPFRVGVADGVHHVTRRLTSRAALSAEVDLVQLLPAMHTGPSREVLGRVASTAQLYPSHPLTGIELDAEQRAAIELVCSTDAPVAIIGVAGAGKTTLLATLAAACRYNGVEVAGVAKTGKAAVGLRRRAGIHSSTVARLLRHRTLPRGGVLFVDEAAMLNTDELASLCTLALRHDTKLVLVGDDRQLDPIGGPSVFEVISANIATAVLTTNRRQQDPSDRVAVAKFRAGYFDEALASYSQRGRMRAYASDADMLIDTVEQVVERVGTARLTDTETLEREPWVITRFRDDANLVNAAVHEALRARGQVSNTFYAPACLVEEDDGQFRFMPTRHFGWGERVMFLRNTWIESGGGQLTFVANGSVGRVAGDVDDALLVRLEDGQIAHVPRAYVERHVDWAYAATTHKLQGDTVREAIVYRADAFDAGALYTAITRATETTNFACRYELEERDEQAAQAEAAIAARAAESAEADAPAPPAARTAHEVAATRALHAWLARLREPADATSALAALFEERTLAPFVATATAEDAAALAGMWRHMANGGELPRLTGQEREELLARASDDRLTDEDRADAHRRLAFDLAVAGVEAVLDFARSHSHHPDRTFCERMARLAEAAARALATGGSTTRGVVASPSLESLLSRLGPTAHDVSAWTDDRSDSTVQRLAPVVIAQSLASEIGAHLVSVARASGRSPEDAYQAWLTSLFTHPWTDTDSAVPPPSPLAVALSVGAADVAWRRRRNEPSVRLAPATSEVLQDAWAIEETDPGSTPLSRHQEAAIRRLVPGLPEPAVRAARMAAAQRPALADVLVRFGAATVAPSPYARIGLDEVLDDELVRLVVAAAKGTEVPRRVARAAARLGGYDALSDYLRSCGFDDERALAIVTLARQAEQREPGRSDRARSAPPPSGRRRGAATLSGTEVSSATLERSLYRRPPP